MTDERSPSADEAGTAPGDRRFRPDVQGLRALAILLVVLYHAGVPGIHGGYVGVDVFFVISGFVITGVLLREHSTTGRTSLLSFYGRRARRIIPAATLVIVVTVAATYVLVGSANGRPTAVDGQWASVFLSNFHFSATATNYLAAQRPPSPLQNFWSLAVEEQFYIVYPTVFLITARLFTRRSLTLRIGVVLGATALASLVLSILWTPANPAAAFFSPFTRAWELGLGCLVAVGSSSLQRLPTRVAAAMSWVGLAAILVAACAFTSATVYPGWLVVVPVLGTGLVIGGGTSQPRGGVEAVLALRPLQLLGLVSYSLYLWHWPILIIATDRRGSSGLPLDDNLLLLLLALVAAIGTYWIIENPVRHSVRLREFRWASVLMGSCLIIISLVVTTFAVRSTASVDSSDLAVAASASNCPSPSKQAITALRATYTASHAHAAPQLDTQPLRMAFFGDSTACTLLVGMAAVGPSYGIQVLNGAVIGCGIVSGEPATHYVDGINFAASAARCPSEVATAEASVLRQRPDVIVWASTQEASTSVIDTPGKNVLVLGSRQWRRVIQQRMDRRVDQFLATGAKVVLLQEPPRAQSGTVVTPADRDYETMNTMLAQVAADHPDKVAVIDLASRVCPSGPPCPYVVDGIGKTPIGTVRPDEIHYSATGALFVARWLIPRILTATGGLH